jgi:hypothetical protein
LDERVFVACGMRTIVILLIITSLIGFGFIAKRTDKKAAANKSLIAPEGSPVILELFTSEGCSSCPPADKLLGQIASTRTNVIPLSFHVDYWNHLGWTDPFSNATFTMRQHEYVERLKLESAYTPELVVNGEYEMVGSDRMEVNEAIKKASGEVVKVFPVVRNVELSENKIQFKVELDGNSDKLDIHAALVQSQARMKVNAGENTGATLTHINVVRVFETQRAKNEIEFKLNWPAGLEKNNWQLIVYAQQNDGKIVGATIYRQ